ncbi:hypothetical protein ESA94_08710 [Lacibacter luteus]|uniref:Uncharacterized protein n=1 Tax=Lacibacter luteus TaxID=2508719 RepID=A0A4Q1CIU0_9BACT|nr:hypothetical protein [Lacibacter luteus]RXK60540.1 hypothetical protein ESA94_08710 [Lacibacter luteus]
MKSKLLLFFLFFTATAATAQFNELVLRKNGIALKRFREGSVITLQTKLGMRYTGVIYLIQKDSIYFSGGGIHMRDVAVVYKKQKGRHRVLPVDGKTFLITNAGIPLFTAGLVISGEPFRQSLLGAIGLVYIPVALYNLQQLIFKANKRYRIGSKYDLQMLDFYPPEKVPEKNQ